MDMLDIIHMERILEELAQGTSLYKVKSASKMLERTFFLDLKNMSFYYDGSKKKGKETSLRISKIREVREGEKDYSKKIKDLEKNLIFVVILGSSQNLYMMAGKQQTRDKWVRGLRYAIQIEQLEEARNETDRNIRDAFNMADKNGDGGLDFDEVMKLLKALNADVKKKYAREMFDAADTNKNVGKGRNSVLDRDEFVDFYHKLTKRVEVEEVFLRYSRGKGFMALKDLLSFLREGQKNALATEENCRNIIDQFESDKVLRMKEHFSADAFRKLITSERQQLFNPAHRVVYQDMTRPMTHYFIDSSHNTYLARDQLRGPSQVEMYIRALQKGCRCVELDCWDGSDGMPVIYHGHTLTSKIRFDDVIKAIDQFAFETSPYPVTLSLENHCSIEQQEVMAHIMTSAFGNKIWQPQADMIHIPSPEELKYKIVIKGKKLSKSAEDGDGDVTDEDEAANVPQVPDPNNANDGGSSSNNNNNNNSQEKKVSTTERKKIKLDRQLSVVTTMKSIGLKSVESNPEPVQYFSVISIGESKAEKMAQSQAELLNTITHHRLIRTYPSGTRTDSSNYNPVPMWNAGCQIVALNYQTGGEAMQLNHGRFMDNGGTGYILKPHFLLSGENFGVVTGSKKRSASKNLKITIVSGFQIPKPNDSSKGEVIDPYVKVEIHGVPADVNDFKTKVIENNGFNPRWYETCVFPLTVPELAMVRFVVIDQDPARDDFIGYFCLPVLSMQQGFRHFPLYDKRGVQFKQSLIFTHIAITDA